MQVEEGGRKFTSSVKGAAWKWIGALVTATKSDLGTPNNGFSRFKLNDQNSLFLFLLSSETYTSGPPIPSKSIEMLNVGSPVRSRDNEHVIRVPRTGNGALDSLNLQEVIVDTDFVLKRNHYASKSHTASERPYFPSTSTHLQRYPRLNGPALYELGRSREGTAIPARPDCGVGEGAQ